MPESDVSDDPAPPSASPDPGSSAAHVAEAAAVAVDPLEREVSRARAASALFGTERAVTVGRYRLLERIGAGGMGVVWSAADPELGRTVALKLATAGDEAARAKAREEGRVLAKLSHPNVVPIYDVLDSEHGVFLVMELVRGQTLRALAQALRDAPASAHLGGRAAAVRTLVRAYREAAEGLGAAHAAGLIHRDFKPDNAIVGADGRVRVLDFGLAIDASQRSGAIAGTPRYMAPEQRDGTLSAAADQYALCASLREAFHEARVAPLPRWLAPILERGGAADPAARYASMAELAAALGRDPAAVWRRRGAVAFAVAAVAVGVLVGRQQAGAPSCEAGGAMIAQAWGVDRERQLAHLMSLDDPYVAAGRAQLLGAFDDYARRWQLTHRASCQAHARGELTSLELDRRTGCLLRGRAALATATRVAGEVVVAQLPELIAATAALPDLARCADDAALTTPVPSPPSNLAEPIAAVERQLAELAVLRDAARLDEARAMARHAMATAYRLGYAPLTAHVYLARARIEAVSGLRDRGAGDYRIAARLALGAGDDATAVEAFARYAFAAAAGNGTDGPAEGVEWMEELAERSGARDPAVQALFQGYLGLVARTEGDLPRARARFHRAVLLARGLTGPRAAELAFVRHAELLLLDEPAEIAQRSAELLALRTAQLGADHPFTLRDRASLATLAADDAQVLAALAPACRQLSAYPRLALALGDCAAEVALLTLLTGKPDALAEWAQLMGRGEGQRADAVILRARAFAHLAAGEPAAALAVLRTARDELKVGPTSRFWIRAMAVELSLAAAAVARTLGDRAAALAELDLARRQLAACRAELPAPLVHRREAEIAALAASP